MTQTPQSQAPQSQAPQKQAPAMQRSNGNWGALALLFLAQMAAIGSTSYGFGLLVKPLAEELALPRADVNRALMILIIGNAVFSPLVGRALDRLSPRIVVAGGAACFALGWLAIAVSTNVVIMLAATFLLLASGMATLGPVTASTLVARWFDNRRGLALGIVSVSSSFGGLLVVPLLGAMIEWQEWRGAVATFGTATGLIVIGLAMLLIPREAPSRAAGEGTAQRRENSLKRLLQTRDFWLIALALGTIMAINGALLSSLISWSTDQGHSLPQATLLVSAISGTAIIGKLVIGRLCDKFAARWLFIGVVMLNAALLLLLMTAPSFTVLLVGVAVTGPAVGGVVPLWAAISASRFGTGSLGFVMGCTASLMMPINLLGLHTIGAAFDLTGSYNAAFELFLAGLGLAALAMLAVSSTRHANLQNA